jgi:hypothetical protein
MAGSSLYWRVAAGKLGEATEERENCPVDSAAPDGRCGQLGDVLATKPRVTAGARNEPVPELPTATLDKPSACPQALGQAGAPAMKRLPLRKGAGLPTLPTGTTTTISIF